MIAAPRPPNQPAVTDRPIEYLYALPAEAAKALEAMRKAAFVLGREAQGRDLRMSERAEKLRLAENLRQWAFDLTPPVAPPPAEWGIDRAELALLPFRLTKRQIETYQALLRGFRAKEIAAHLGVSINTVRTHMQAVYDAYGVDSQAALIRQAAATTRFTEIERQREC